MFIYFGIIDNVIDLNIDVYKLIFFKLVFGDYCLVFVINVLEEELFDMIIFEVFNLNYLGVE